MCDRIILHNNISRENSKDVNITLFTINASYVHTNLAIRCIGRALETHGFSPNYLECTDKDKHCDVLEKLYSLSSDIYGFSCYIWNVGSLLYYAENLKKLLPGCRIVFGGPEVSHNAESFIRDYPFIDNIICGEGEEAFPELCASPDTSPAVIYSRAFEGFADAGILYGGKGMPHAAIAYYESSRGCPYRCAYCLSSKDNKIRYKTSEKTLSELEVFEKLEEDIRIIKFIDRTFNFNPARARQIWSALSDDKYTKRYHFEICASLLTDECFKVLERLPRGKVQFEVGVQSTYEPALSAVNRINDTDKCLENLRRLMELGNIHVHADLIAGLPEESYKRFGESFDALYPLCHQLQLGFLKILGGTDMLKIAEKYNYVYDSYPPYEVLSSDSMSFEDIHRLKAIEELTERFKNSGRFSNALQFLMRYVPSPFEFFEIMAGRLKNSVSLLSQPNAYKLLDECAAQYISSDNEMTQFRSRLAMDYIINQASTVPDFLSRISTHVPFKRLHNEYPNLNSISPEKEYRLFPHLQGKIVAVDRKNHKYDIIELN